MLRATLSHMFSTLLSRRVTWIATSLSHYVVMLIVSTSASACLSTPIIHPVQISNWAHLNVWSESGTQGQFFIYLFIYFVVGMEIHMRHTKVFADWRNILWMFTNLLIPTSVKKLVVENICSLIAGEWAPLRPISQVHSSWVTRCYRRSSLSCG